MMERASGVDGFMGKRVAAGLRAALFLLWIVVTVPFQLVVLAEDRKSVV